MLYATRNELPFEVNACYHLVDQDLEGALKALEGEEQVDPREMAVVKFSPSAENPNAQYADEIYYPPVVDQKAAIRDIILPQNAIDIFDMEDPYVGYTLNKRTWIPQMRRRSIPLGQGFNPNYNIPNNFRIGEETRDKLEFLRPIPSPKQLLSEDEEYSNGVDINSREAEITPEDLEEFYPMMDYIYKLRSTTEGIKDLPVNVGYQKLKSLLYDFARIERPEDVDVGNLLNRHMANEQNTNPGDSSNVPERFSLSYNTPDNFRAGWETRDLLDDDIPESRVYIDEADEDYPEEYGSGTYTATDEIFRELKQINKHQRERDEEEMETPRYPDEDEIFRELKQMRKDEDDSTFTEVPKNSTSTVIRLVCILRVESYMLQKLKFWVNEMKTEDSLNENLDELLEEYRMGFQRPERLDVKKPGPMFDSQRTTNTPPVEDHDVILPAMMKKEPRGAHPNPSHEIYDVDTDYVFVGFHKSIQMWRQGDEIIQNISRLLDLEPGTLDSGRVDRNEVTFRVHQNKYHLNASEIARRIVTIRDELKKSTGVEITAVGVGDKVRRSNSSALDKQAQISALLMLMVFTSAVKRYEI
ncbi:receptor-type tyrosine-protein phosphatase [Holotrichia oblita]|uniref:Receptor-type tyrosine-protein phosphatase n=1 Tax=Holotrichia oblita TaxID=644536 RepID=A0ACB9T4Y5_HOLOL|nr:receptor-type tyrosine-protein phosphatase [Holotrichia oblita]